MKDENQRLKLCPFCEGRIDSESIECMFCGATLLYEKKETAEDKEGYSEENLAHFYSPPYQGNGTSESSYREEELPQESPGYSYNEPQKKYSSHERVSYAHTTRAEDAVMDSGEKEKGATSVFPLLLLSIGGQIFTLGWLLFFFSEGGLLMLEWKARFWFVYILLSLPFFYLGWKKLSSEE